MFNTEGASCIGLDPELFFPSRNINPKIEKLLKKTCLNCPVFDGCIDYALNVDVKGFWAGTTETGRVKLRKMMNIKALRIDQEYKDLVDIPTPGALEKRRSMKRLAEARETK